MQIGIEYGAILAWFCPERKARIGKQTYKE